jgi:hypothetical protein
MSKQILPEGGAPGLSRRRFLAGSGAVLGAAALAGVAGLPGLTPGQQAGVRIAHAAGLSSDMDILQFALTLEHLEDTAYRTVNASGVLKGTVADYFKTFGDQEHAHVVALTNVITKMGAQPVAEQSKYFLPTLTTQDDVVKFFAQVEEVGAGAYLGAAPLLQNKDLLAAAAAIHNVEAQHASTLRAVMGDMAPSPAFGSPLTYDQVIAAVTPLLQGGAPAPSGKYYTLENPAPSIAAAMSAVPAVANSAGLAYVPETQHTISAAFLTYWQQNNGLTMVGYPITEPYMGPSPTNGQNYVQQYFQRARLEWHPEHKGTQFEVQLGLLGAEQLFHDMMGRP